MLHESHHSFDRAADVLGNAQPFSRAVGRVEQAALASRARRQHSAFD